MSSSVGRNSLIMAAGTAASRVTGQVRTILLAAALGTTGIAANAYQAGAMIPQAVFALVSGGIFNAVLVPQIVRTLKEKDAEERLNKLISLAIALLLAITALMTVATPLLTRLYVGQDTGPEMQALTNAFTLWCMPQIFFYGLYTVLGQILAAKNHFGMYAWSSVGANVISCAGFTAFILLFGKANEQPLEFWTPARITLIAGSWTLGVAFQALILFLPLMRCGLRYRPKWGISGIGLRAMGSVAGWSIGIVVVDQLASIISTRITTSAPATAERLLGIAQIDVAGNATYQNAFTLYVLPYSLIAVSVATAMFPRISQAIGDRDIDDARGLFSQSLRNVGVLMIFFTVAFIVMPVPVILALLPSVSVKEAIMIAAPLMTQGIGLPLSSAYLIIQRTFYAFEDGKNPFLFMLLFNILYVGILLGSTHVLSPVYWVTMLGISSTIGHLLAFPFLVKPLRARFGGHLDGKRITIAYLKAVVAGVAAVVCGLALQHPVYRLVGAQIGRDDGSMNWFQAVAVCVILTVVSVAVYAAVLWLMRSDELVSATRMVAARLGMGRAGAKTGAVADGDAADHGAAHDAAPGTDTASAVGRPAADPADRPRLSGDAQPPVPAVSANAASPLASTTPTARMAQQPQSSEHTHYGVGKSMKPQLGDTIANRYTLVALLRDETGLEAWKASDRVLTRDCQLFLITDRRVLDQVTAIASALALIKNRQFTQVLQMQRHGDAALIITQLDAGLSLTHYLKSSTGRILSFNAMRSIMGETTQAVRTLLSQGLTHQAIGTDTVRVSVEGVQLADTPLSSMLQDVSGSASQNLPAEVTAVRQLAALLYAMLTRTPSSPDARFDLSRIGADVPGEFKLICKRGLGLPGNGTDLPMSSLAELDALLGDWTPLGRLLDRDIALPGISGDASISSVTLLPRDGADLADIPGDIINSNPMPALTLNMPKYSTALDSDDVVDVTPMTGDLFSAFDGQTGTPNKSTLSLDVSSIRHPSEESEAAPETVAIQPPQPVVPIDPSMEETQIIPPIGSEPIPHGGDAPTDDAYEPDQQSKFTLNIPADETVADQKLFGGLPTKIISVIVGVIVLIVAGTLAVNSLIDDTQGNIGGSGASSDPFSDENLDAVPFGKSTNGSQSDNTDSADSADKKDGNGTDQSKDSADTANKDANKNQSSDNANDSKKQSSDSNKSDSNKKDDSSKQTVETKDKNVQSVPAPRYENNTPLSIASQQFVTDPGGQRGYAYHLHLNEAHDTYRLVVHITTSGGKGYIYANTTGDPNQGDQVGEFTFAEGGTTEVKFTKVTKTQDIVMWVPADSMPNNQLYIQKVELF